jgi:FG-GAP-like repeat
MGYPSGIADHDGDGFLDFAISTAEAGSGLWFHQADGTFSNSATAPSLVTFMAGNDPYAHLVLTNDFNGDGLIDPLIHKRGYRRFQIYRQASARVFELVLEATSWDSDAVAIADMDNDGKMDVVSGTGDSVTIYRNTSGGD